MDADTLLNLALVLLFVLIGGVFAGTEMAIVNVRQSQVRAIESTGPRGARTAALVRNPNLFLSAVQIGVTVAGFFSSAYGASTIAPDIEPWLVSLGLGEQAASTTALIGLTRSSPTCPWCSGNWSPSGWRCRTRWPSPGSWPHRWGSSRS